VRPSLHKRCSIYIVVTARSIFRIGADASQNRKLMRGPRANYHSSSGSVSTTRGPRINLLLAAGFAPGVSGIFHTEQAVGFLLHYLATFA
jgi:hypothetical protein